MSERRLSRAHLAFLATLSVLALLPGLGRSGRLTYHEALVAQGAGEILQSGAWGYPTIGGLPWLEKPPLPWWLVAVVARYTGGVTETAARFPSALAALGVVLAVALLAARHYGPRIGLLAGAIQATTAWTITRGRLAEADMLLTCAIAWAIVAFDRIQTDPRARAGRPSCSLPWRWHLARWSFFALLGATALVKGIGFGAVLILAVVIGMLLWQRDVLALRHLQFPAGWILAMTIALAWPLSMLAMHGRNVLSLWYIHVSNRLFSPAGTGQFAGEPWWEFVPTLFAQALPWTPAALWGAWHSLRRALSRGVTDGASTTSRANIPIAPEVIAGDRLLCVWTAAPLSLLAMAVVKNAHYAISAQLPWSIWAALGLMRFFGPLEHGKGNRRTPVLVTRAGFVLLALAYSLGLWLIRPWYDERGVEWAFYELAGRRCPRGMPLALLYDDWDRNPYDCGLGAIPHDLAVRLFYLGRPACWHCGAESLSGSEHSRGRCSSKPDGRATEASTTTLSASMSGSTLGSSFAVIGRDRDLLALEQLGSVELIARGPRLRDDRSYSLFRITPTLTTGRVGDRVRARARDNVLVSTHRVIGQAQWVRSSSADAAMTKSAPE